MTWEGDRREQVEALIAEWKARLGVPHWDVRLANEPPDAGDRATADIWFKKASAIIRMRDDAPPEVWPELVIHELLHVVLCPVRDGVVETAITEYVPSAQQRTLRTDWDEAVEQVIHHLTVAFTGHGLQCWPEGDPFWSKSFGVQ